VEATLACSEALLTTAPGEAAATNAAIAQRLPTRALRALRTGPFPGAASEHPARVRTFEAMLTLVRRLHAAGVPLAIGTDQALWGPSLHRELELHVRAGIPAAEVLSLATLGAARLMKRDRELGSVHPGKAADLVLVDGDPTTRIEDIRRVVTVVKAGIVYDPQALSTAVGLR
jgi:imidazolonepropionase-like amidohydrolase